MVNGIAIENNFIESIPFIIFDKQFQVNPEALFILNQYNDKIGVIAIWGVYRTGKSYLLNKIIEGKCKAKNQKVTDYNENLKTSFNVGSTINSWTKGLWILKEPIYVTKDNKEMPVFVIDTEGLGAIDEEYNHDTKIFLLSLLLSSLFIYNSFGAIDENTLNTLSLAIELSTHLDDLGDYFPSFLWVLRDFSLKLEDENGSEISAKMYLETALKEQKGSSDKIEAKNRIRRMIKHFFKERDLSVLLRPTDKDVDLQNLMWMSNEDLRKEFVDGLNNLKTKIFKKVNPKKLKDKFITGPMLADLAWSYAKTLNDGGIPKISSTWEYMVNAENQKGLDRALRNITDQINEIQKDLPIDENMLINYKNTVFKNSVKIFQEISIVDNEKNNDILLEKIAEKLEEEYLNLIRINKIKIKELIQDYFNDKFRPMVKENLRKELYTWFEDYDKEAELFKGKMIHFIYFRQYYFHLSLTI